MIVINKTDYTTFNARMCNDDILLLIKTLSQIRRIQAIKLMISAFGISLKEAKEYIDYHYPQRIGEPENVPCCYCMPYNCMLDEENE